MTCKHHGITCKAPSGISRHANGLMKYVGTQDGAQSCAAAFWHSSATLPAGRSGPLPDGMLVDTLAAVLPLILSA